MPALGIINHFPKDVLPTFKEIITVFLGHSRPGKVQDHHHGVLPRGHGLHPDVRHHERGVLQRRPGLVSER